MKRFARKSHRWIGILSCVFLLVVSFTAIALNHRNLWLSWNLRGDTETTFSLSQSKAFAADPFVANHLMASSEKQLFESFDGGKQWKEVKLFVPAEHIVSIAYSPSTPEALWVALKNIGVFFSEDNGIIWESIDSLPPDPVAGETLQSLTVGAGNQLYVKTALGLYSAAQTLPVTETSPAMQWHKEIQQNATQKLDWQELVWKLHTGQFFGAWGVYLYDAVALSLIFLSLSGLVLARRKRLKAKKA